MLGNNGFCSVFLKAESIKIFEKAELARLRFLAEITVEKWNSERHLLKS